MAWPFLMSFFLASKPDSTESLALRLWQELQNLKAGTQKEMMVDAWLKNGHLNFGFGCFFLMSKVRFWFPRPLWPRRPSTCSKRRPACLHSFVAATERDEPRKRCAKKNLRFPTQNCFFETSDSPKLTIFLCFQDCQDTEILRRQFRVIQGCEAQKTYSSTGLEFPSSASAQNTASLEGCHMPNCKPTWPSTTCVKAGVFSELHHLFNMRLQGQGKKGKDDGLINSCTF